MKRAGSPEVAETAAPEPGLNRVEVVLAFLHALALTGAAALVAALALGRKIEHVSIAESRELGHLSVFTGAFIGSLALLLFLASRRAARTRLGRWDKVRCGFSGVVAGSTIVAFALHAIGYV